MIEFAIRRLLVVAIAGAFAVSCSSGPLKSVGGVFGGGAKAEKSEDDEEDERISILTYQDSLKADPKYVGLMIELPPSYPNSSWPQPGGEADHTLHHLSGDITLEKVWSVDIGSASPRRARLTSPPIIADGRIYVADAEARVSAFDLETGARLWRAELRPQIKDKFRLRDALARSKAAQIGFGGGVAYDGGRVFVSSGFGFVAGINAESGEEIWRFKADAPVRTPPTAHRGAIYFVTITNEMIALDQATGEKQWAYQSFEEPARILSSASPAAAGDLIVAPFSSGEVVAFLAGTGRAVWNDTLAGNTSLTSLSTLNDIAGSPVIDRGLVYVVSHAGRFAAIDIRSGQRVWEIPVASLQMPWVAGDFIFLVSVDGEVLCIDRESGSIVWVSELRRYENQKKRKNRIAYAGPIVVGDHLIFVSSRGELLKISAQTGAIEATKKIGDGSLISPIVVEERIYVLTEKGKLLAFK